MDREAKMDYDNVCTCVCIYVIAVIYICVCVINMMKQIGQIQNRKYSQSGSIDILNAKQNTAFISSTKTYDLFVAATPPSPRPWPILRNPPAKVLPKLAKGQGHIPSLHLFQARHRWLQLPTGRGCFGLQFQFHRAWRNIRHDTGTSKQRLQGLAITTMWMFDDV